MGVAVIKIICIIYISIPFNLIRLNIRYNFNWPGSFFCVNVISKSSFNIIIDYGVIISLKITCLHIVHILANGIKIYLDVN